MRTIAYIAIILLLLVQSFGKAWLVLSYQLNKEHIAANYCVERHVPKSCCKGKCYLRAQLQDAEERERETPQPAPKNQETAFSGLYVVPEVPHFQVFSEVECAGFAPIASIESGWWLPAESLLPQDFCGGFFHPPTA